MPDQGIVGSGPMTDFPNLAGLTLLLVDDDADSLYVAAELLRACCATVLTATTGAEALERLDSQLPDAIVTDLCMPVMDGVQLLHRIRARPDVRNVPVIALTSFQQRYLDGASGFDYFFQKPMDIDALGAAIVKLTRRP
jgi:CheY-like chemotaxis protein